ncbi:hypothetical protein AB0G73_28560 [Streptomyces sp. NPDC020719]|uniref:hypothetical protein n=1 Tax=Streptomyces sp. NPDC020719 TaxID=3154896 RepID=UPI0033DD6B0E
MIELVCGQAVSALAAGWPIATSAVKGARRQLIGARSGRTNATAVLKIRGWYLGPAAARESRSFEEAPEVGGAWP